MVALGLEQPAKEGGGRAHLLLDVETLEIENGRDPMLTDAAGDAGEFGLSAGGVDDQMPEFAGEADEIALGIDDDLLHVRGALLEQPAQQMRLARPRIALHQEAGRQQFLEIEVRSRAAGGRSHVDGNIHRVCESIRSQRGAI